MTDDGSFLLHWDLHEQNRTSCISDLWKNDAFLDVTIVCEDGQVDAHKLILSAASPTFQKILLRNQYNVGRPLLYLWGIYKKDMEALLEFVYSGETRITSEDLEKFMEIAGNLKIRGLVGDAKSKHPNRLENMKVEKPSNHESAVLEENLKTKDAKRIDDEMIDTNESVKNTVFGIAYAKKEIIDIGNHTVKTAEVDISQAGLHIKESQEKLFTNSIIENSGSIDDENIDTSLEEYEKRVLELFKQQDKQWFCCACTYSSQRISHMKEHVEMHIKGFVIRCNMCGKSFPRKASLRQHFKYCKNQMVNITL